MAASLFLRHAYAFSEEHTVELWSENPYWRHFSGERPSKRPPSNCIEAPSCGLDTRNSPRTVVALSPLHDAGNKAVTHLGRVGSVVTVYASQVVLLSDGPQDIQQRPADNGCEGLNAFPIRASEG